jgi:hypothetical protein
VFPSTAMSSLLFSEDFELPDSWPALDAEALPLPPSYALEDHWRESQRVERRRAGNGSNARRPMPRAPLSPLAQRWYDDLPAAVLPRRTAARHPHVLNQLALVWDRPMQRRDTLRDLLLADRHDRQGFSFEVLEELARLQAHVTD